MLVAPQQEFGPVDKQLQQSHRGRVPHSTALAWLGAQADRKHSPVLFRGAKNKKEGRKGFVTRDRYNVTNGALCFTTQTMEERTARESAVSEEGQVEIRVCRAWRRTVSLLTPVRMEAENYA